MKRLDFYASNATYHLKGQKKQKSLSHMLLVLKKMVQRRGTKLTRLDFYAPNARYHLKGQEIKKPISYASCTKKWYTIEGQN